MLERIDVERQVALTDPRYYNIRWLELLHEIEPQIEQFGASSAPLSRMPATAGSLPRSRLRLPRRTHAAREAVAALGRGRAGCPLPEGRC